RHRSVHRQHRVRKGLRVRSRALGTAGRYQLEQRRRLGFDGVRHRASRQECKNPGTFCTVVDGTWSGRGSGSDCGKNNDYAGTGKYELKIATLGGEPAKTSFALTAKKDKSDADSKKDGQKNDKSDNKDNSK